MIFSKPRQFTHPRVQFGCAGSGDERHFLVPAGRSCGYRQRRGIVLAVLSSWAVVALVNRLSLAPGGRTRTGEWLLNALMVAVGLLALLSSIIVYRSARRARSV